MNKDVKRCVAFHAAIDARACALALALACLASTAAAEKVELKNGDVIHGVVTRNEDGSIVVQSPTVGRVEILASEIKEAEAEEVKPGIFGTSFMRGWNKSIGAGISGQSGISDSIDAVFNANADTETDHWRHQFRSSYFFSETDDVTSDNKAFVQQDENWKPFAGKFFLFGLGRYDYDELKDWNHRIEFDAGVGYELYKSERIELRGRAGSGVIHTWQGENGTHPEGVFRIDWKSTLVKGIVLEMDHSYFPVWDDLPEFRFLSNVDWKADVGKEGGLVLVLGLRNEYDSQLAGPNNDLNYYLRLDWEL